MGREWMQHRWPRVLGAVVIAIIGAAALEASLVTARSSIGPAPQAVARPLQPLIDATATGGTLTLAPGLYAGPATITRSLSLRGAPGAVIDGGGIGSILTVEADDVGVAGLTFRNTGDRLEEIDAAVRLRGRHAVVKDNRIEDCLFGIEIKQSDGNVVRRNRIGSKTAPGALRGDAVRLWYSTGNLVEGNDIAGVRDGIGMQAVGNRIRDNRVADSRYGVQLLYAHANEIAGNRLTGDAVGIMAIGSNDLVITGNIVHDGRDAGAKAILLKDSNRARVIGNDLLANAQAVYLDASPAEPDQTNLFRDNRFGYNAAAVVFHSDLTGNVFEANTFVGNHAEVVVDGGGTALNNVWNGNAWDAYEGFDRDRDGVGDTPFEVWSWTDRLWMDVPPAQFFRGAPSLALFDFVERLGAFREPRLMMRDAHPHLAAGGDPLTVPAARP